MIKFDVRCLVAWEPLVWVLVKPTTPTGFAHSMYAKYLVLW